MLWSGFSASGRARVALPRQAGMGFGGAVEYNGQEGGGGRPAACVGQVARGSRTRLACAYKHHYKTQPVAVGQRSFNDRHPEPSFPRASPSGRALVSGPSGGARDLKPGTTGSWPGLEAVSRHDPAFGLRPVPSPKGSRPRALCARSPWLRATPRNRTQAKEKLGRSPSRTQGRGGSPCPPIGPAGRGGSPCPPIRPNR